MIPEIHRVIGNPGNGCAKKSHGGRMMILHEGEKRTKNTFDAQTFPENCLQWQKRLGTETAAEKILTNNGLFQATLFRGGCHTNMNESHRNSEYSAEKGLRGFVNGIAAPPNYQLLRWMNLHEM
jgi:hypothetical protein